MKTYVFYATYKSEVSGNRTEEKINVTAGNLRSAWRGATLRATQAPMSEKNWTLIGMIHDYQ